MNQQSNIVDIGNVQKGREGRSIWGAPNNFGVEGAGEGGIKKIAPQAPKMGGHKKWPKKGGIKNFGVEGAGGGSRKNYGFQKYTPPPFPYKHLYHITSQKL